MFFSVGKAKNLMDIKEVQHTYVYVWFENPQDPLCRK